METLINKKEEYDLKLDSIKSEMFMLLLKDIVTDEDVIIGKKLIDQWQHFSLLRQSINDIIINKQIN